MNKGILLKGTISEIIKQLLQLIIACRGDSSGRL